MNSAPNARVCEKCGKPKGCVPFYWKGVVKYWHLLCFIKMKKEKTLP
jgi:hypothetical protein